LRIGVIGCGYIGLVTGSGLAKLGHQVTCTDRNKEIINSLKQGVVPFYEPGLTGLVKEGFSQCSLAFTHNLSTAVQEKDVIIMAVGTPAMATGEVDLRDLFSVAGELSSLVSPATVIVIKSTVLPGTIRRLEELFEQEGNPKNLAVVANPEFLREGSAVKDFFHPHRIVLGGREDWALAKMQQLYEKLAAPVLVTDSVSAELIKYAANTFLATKISFINEMARICQLAGADIEVVAKGMGMDKRIGHEFLRPGVGFGGSCLPKDTLGLVKWSETLGYSPEIVRAAVEVNRRQRSWVIDTVKKSLGDSRGKKITVLGLSFKPDTSDIREAPALDIIKRLRAEGASLRVYDPVVRQDAHPVLSAVDFGSNSYEALEGADCCILLTEWTEFRELDFVKVREIMNEPVIIDGRNLLKPQKVKRLGFKYYDMGRSHCLKHDKWEYL